MEKYTLGGVSNLVGNRGTEAISAALLRARFGFAGAAFLAFLLSLCGASQTLANCQTIPAGKTFWVRLIDPVASYSSKPGTPVRAILIQSPECDFAPVFPAGLEVAGQISSVRRVGMGLIHDTASVEIQFDHIVTSDGSVLPIASQVVEIDNAREGVRNGVIRGVRATNTPQGRITSRLAHLPTFNPYSDMGLIIYRALTVLPEPEIYLPPGTDIRLRLNVPLYVGDQPEIPRVSFAMDEYERGDVEMLMQHSSDRTTTRSGKDADLVNILFVGTGEQIEQAFTAAGWLPADPNSKTAFLKQFGAFLTLSSYPNMPISRQLLNGQLQDSTWQKSFNAYGKREHVRLWGQNRTVQGQQAWLAASTRETSAALSLRYHKFIHHISRNLDDGVNMLVRDLSLTGCVDSVRQLPRPELTGILVNSTGDEMKTEGVLTVVHIKQCDEPSIQYARGNPLVPIHPKSRVARYFRSQILVYKSDVIRGNIIYSAFDLTRMSVRSFRHRHDSRPDDDDDLPMSPVSPDTLFPAAVPGEIPLGR